MARISILPVAAFVDPVDFTLSAAVGATVTVNLRKNDGTSGVNATVYSGPTGSGTVSQPLTVPADGHINGWVEPGRYNLVFTSFLGTVTEAWDAPSVEQTFNLFDFGAVFDGLPATASINSGSSVLTGAWPVASDVGKAVMVPGAGPAGASLLTTITTPIIPGVSVTLSLAASTTVSNVTCIYGTDDTPAWEAAFNRLYDLRGGTILVTPPESPAPNLTFYSIVTRPIDAGEPVAGTFLYHMQGGNVIGTSGGGSAAPTIAYVAGAGAGPMFRFLSCFNMHIEGLSMLVTNPDFNDDLVRFEHGAAGDCMQCTVRKCGFGSTAPATAPVNTSYLKFAAVIFCHAIDCKFADSYSGSGIELAGAFINGCSVRRNVFSHCRNQILISSTVVQALTIEGNTFEPSWGGQAGAIVGSATCNIYSASIRDNWFGDVEWAGRSWIENLYGASGTVEIDGNYFGSPGANHGAVVTTTRAGSGSFNEQQTVRVSATSGNFTLTFSGQTTANIAVAAAAANANVIKTALEALSNIAPGDVVVTAQHGPTHDYPTAGRTVYYEWLVEFQGAYALTNVAEMTATDVDLLGYGAYFNLGGSNSVFEIHNNNLSASGTVLDLTKTHGGTTSPPCLSLHSNTVNTNVTQFAANSNSTPVLELGGAGYAAWGNNQVNYIIPHNIRRDQDDALISVYPHTLTSANAGKRLISTNNGTALTITIPPDGGGATEFFPNGFEQEIMQAGTGAVTIAPGAGVVLRPQPGGSLISNGQYSVIKIHKKATNEWSVSGNTIPGPAGSKTFDWPSVADGASTSTTVTVTGAVIGDYAVPSMNVTGGIPAGAVLSASITSAGSATVTLFNKTGAPLDLASGTLAVRVLVA